MKMKTMFIVGSIFSVLLSSCSKTDTTAQISDRMMMGLAKAKDTTSYTIQKTVMEEPANEECIMNWKDEDTIYILDEFGFDKRMELIRFDGQRFEELFCYIGINVLEVQSIEKGERYYGYLSKLYLAIRFPMKLDDRGRSIGLKPEFEWSLKNDTIHAVLKVSERDGFNARFLVEAQRELTGLTDLNMKVCEYTFHFDQEGYLVEIDENYELEWIYGEQSRTTRQNDVMKISYEDVNEKLKAHVQRAFEKEVNVGDNIEWADCMMPIKLNCACAQVIR